MQKQAVSSYIIYSNDCTMYTSLATVSIEERPLRTPLKKAIPQDIDQLLERVLQHDDYAAFEKLFNGHYNPLRSFCKKLVNVEEVAEELVSEVFFKVWNNRKRIVIASSAKSYLYTAVRNMAFDYLRKEKKSLWVDIENAKELTSDEYDPQKQSEVEELKLRIESAVADLPKQCRLVFQLSRDHGMKYNEIAEMLRLSVKTVETQMGRAFKSLRKSLLTE
jgi:RNA polymerase sigma-70 factor, ECF subfamily